MARVRGPTAAHRVEIHGQAKRIDIHPDGLGPDQADSGGAGDIGVRDGDDLVALADAEREQRDLQRSRPRIRCHGERRAEPGGEFRLEGRHLMAPVEPSAFQHAADRAVDVIAAARIEQGVIVERDGHGVRLRATAMASTSSFTSERRAP